MAHVYARLTGDDYAIQKASGELRIMTGELNLQVDIIDHPETSVLQPWVQKLGLRHQGVLLAAVRGCDTAPRNDPSKNLVRCFRAEIMIPFCGDPKKSASFIEGVHEAELHLRMLEFLKDFDHYPSHYVGHLMLAAEIVGYKKPSNEWLWFYQRYCKGLHVTPETEEELDARLGASEEEFGKAQHHVN